VKQDREGATFCAYMDAQTVWCGLLALPAWEKRERRVELDLWQGIMARCAAEYRRLRGSRPLF